MMPRMTQPTLGLVVFATPHTQGSRYAPTLGFETKPRWGFDG